MKTDIKNFPRGLDEKDLLYLIWKALLGMQGGSSDGGSDSSDSGSDSGDGSFEQVQADWEQADTEAVDYIKNKPSILAPMIVEGTADEMGNFTPVSGAPAWSEAQNHMFSGGLVYILILDDGEPVAIGLANFADSEVIASTTGDWSNPDEGGEGGEES